MKLTAWSILSAAFTPSKQHFKVVLLDLVWRFFWAVASTIIVLIAGFTVVARFGAMRWEGPDLGVSDPIIVLAALRQFWQAHGAFLLVTLGITLLVVAFLWIMLEALFRGGPKGFWIYLGTAVARTTLLVALGAVLGVLSLQDDSGGTLVISAIVILGMWFIVGWLESVTRRDAVELFATDFVTLWIVVGFIWLTEAVVAFIVLGSAVAALLQTMDSPEIALTGVLVGIMVFVWLILHSYLVAVRYQAIDIMRNNVVRG